MRSLLVVLLCVAGLAVSCRDSEPTIAYRYSVEGSGEGVAITFLTENGLTHRTVRLPWTSEESLGSDQSPIRIEADGPPGSRVRCFVRYRAVDGTYGGDGSGETGQYATDPDEDQSRCALDQRTFLS
jgi:hypothetical protein